MKFPSTLLVALALALAPRPASADSFSIVTYNVAGLPQGFSSSTPEINNALISPRLNAYDLVLVQEDFGFHEDLTSAIGHPHQSLKDDSRRPPSTFEIGDGLNRFSRSPFSGHTRVTWNDCFGILTNASDCLAPKGFAYARHELAPGVFVDVYNLHAEAGGSEEDIAARQSGIRQLYATLQTVSPGQALIVTGDFNSRYTREGDIIPELLSATGLRDVWLELKRDGVIPEIGPRLDACSEDGMNGGDCEQIDKILFRSSDTLLLSPLDYAVLDAAFLDSEGVPLSDHDPVFAVFDFQVVPEPGSASLLALGLLGLAGRARRRATELPARPVGPVHLGVVGPAVPPTVPPDGQA